MTSFALVGMLVYCYQETAVYPFPSTESPSKRFVVQHLAEDANVLFDQKSRKSVAKLAGFSGFKGENHGGMSACYSKNELWVAVIQMGKWEPRNLAIVNSSTRQQLSVLRQVQKDALSYVSRSKPNKDNQHLVFDVQGAKWSGATLTFQVSGEIPKSEDGPNPRIHLTYTVKSSKSGIVLGKAKGTTMKPGNVLRWKAAS